MNQNDLLSLNQPGIYFILNTINLKVYVGQAFFFN